MPWETADTVWTVICIIVVALMALAVLAMRAAHDAPKCTCGREDCGGGCLGDGGFYTEPLEGWPGLIVVRRRGYRDTMIGTEKQDRAQLLDETRERIVR